MTIPESCRTTEHYIGWIFFPVVRDFGAVNDNPLYTSLVVED